MPRSVDVVAFWAAMLPEKFTADAGVVVLLPGDRVHHSRPLPAVSVAASALRLAPEPK